MTTKRFNKLSEHVATNVARWSGGTLSPWEGYAALTPQELADLLALAAYATYVVNAAQFILKLRAARLQGAAEAVTNAGAAMEAAQ